MRQALLLACLLGCGLQRAPVTIIADDAGRVIARLQDAAGPVDAGPADDADSPDAFEAPEPGPVDTGPSELDAGPGVDGGSTLELDPYEVSVARFSAYVAAGGTYTPYAGPAAFGFDPSVAASEFCNYGIGREAHPMNCIRRDEAAAFCAWDGGRLPDGNEWEAVAGPAMWPWGDAPPTCNLAHIAGCPGDDGAPTRRVGSTLPTRGVYDLAGNVYEWMLRTRAYGGSWDSSADQCTTTFYLTQYADPAIQHPGIGFRCLREVW